MRNIEDIMTIINTKSNHMKRNILEEIQIMREIKSAGRLIDIISEKNKPWVQV